MNRTRAGKFKPFTNDAQRMSQAQRNARKAAHAELWARIGAEQAARLEKEAKEFAAIIAAQNFEG